MCARLDPRWNFIIEVIGIALIVGSVVMLAVVLFFSSVNAAAEDEPVAAAARP